MSRATDELSTLRKSQGFTVERDSGGTWTIVLEDLPWDMFDNEADAIKECAVLNKECADCI